LPSTTARRTLLSASVQQAREIMARLVKHERNGPYEIAEGTELPAWICGCGLSKNKPFCDGSHKRTKDENTDDIYTYDETSRVKLNKEY
jgi:CDGSH-type Zn-finger protein